jgi:hypothetical protein
VTEPRRNDRSPQTFYFVWAVVATVLGLISTGLVVLLFWQLRAAGTGAAGAARAGWSRWEESAGGNGHWYKAVVLPTGVTWEETSALALQEGGYLATILSEAEERFVFNLVNAPEFFTANNGSGPALGGFQQDGAPEPDGGWCWLNGGPWSYSNWLHKEPNNGRSHFGTEDRLQYYSGMGRTPAATWNDINRGDKSSPIFSYVMERDK